MAPEVLELDPELVSQEIEEDVNIAEKGLGRQIDFIVRSAEASDGTAKEILMEVKYSLPRAAGRQLARLVNQLNNALTTGRGQVVVWSLQQPGLQQLKLLYNALGPKAASVQFVSGVEGLYRYLEFYFGH
jgi:hypothetical protein